MKKIYDISYEVSNGKKCGNKHYCIKWVIKPSITSHFQGLEAVLCLVCVLVLLKCLEEILIYWNGIYLLRRGAYLEVISAYQRFHMSSHKNFVPEAGTP
jgi:hypothetical protein